MLIRCLNLLEMQRVIIKRIGLYLVTSSLLWGTMKSLANCWAKSPLPMEASFPIFTTFCYPPRSQLEPNLRLMTPRFDSPLLSLRCFWTPPYYLGSSFLKNDRFLDSGINPDSCFITETCTPPIYVISERNNHICVYRSDLYADRESILH